MNGGEGRRMNRRLLLVAAVALLAATGAAAWLSVAASEPSSAFASGGSPLVEDARARGLEVLRLASGPGPVAADSSLDPTRTLLVVVAPTEDYAPAEAEALRDFLQTGGQVLVADAFGSANGLTQPLGLVFERVRLVDDDAAEATIQHLRFSLALRNATALHVDADGAQVLARSGPESFIDRDGNGAIDAGDRPGPFDVAAMVPVGNKGGRIVAVADPGLLAGQDALENQAWRRALLDELLPEGGTVLVDESRGGVQDPVLAAFGATWRTVATGPLRVALPLLGAVLALAMLLPTRSRDWVAHRFHPHYFVRRSHLAQDGADGPTTRAGSGWTRRGALVLVAALALALTGLPLASTQATQAAALLAAAALAAMLPMPPSVRATRRTSAARLAEEATLDVELTLRTRGRRGERVEVRDEVPREFQVRDGTNWFQATVGPSSSTVSYTASPALRGPYHVGPLLVRRSDALRLRVHDSLLAPAVRVEVTPRKEPVNRSPFKTRIPSITLGPHMVSRAGDGSEFHALREYQRGDSFRSINWKASARSKGLVVNQRVHESMTTITVFLDARAVSGAGPASQTPLAQGCRMAYSLAAGALQQRDRVHLVVYGDGVHEIPPSAGSRQIHQVSEHLSMLPARGTTTFAQALQPLLPRLKSGNPIVLVSGLEDDDTVVEAMGHAQGRGLIPVVLAARVSTDPVDAEDGGPEPGAAAIQAAREKTISRLRQAGVQVFDAVPDLPLDTLFRVGVVA